MVGAEADPASDDDVTSGKDPGRAGFARDTMAKKVARANKFSVAESATADEDFPSLGGDAAGPQHRSAGTGELLHLQERTMAPISQNVCFCTTLLGMQPRCGWIPTLNKFSACVCVGEGGKK